MPQLLNSKATRRFVLETAASLRAHNWTRVAGESLELLEADLRAAVVRRIKQLPSKGKTIKF